MANDPAATALVDLMREVPATVGVETDIRERGRAASKYNLLSVPVVDEAGAAAWGW